MFIITSQYFYLNIYPILLYLPNSFVRYICLFIPGTHTKQADNTWQSLKFLLSSALLEFVGSHKVGELCNPQRYVFYGQQIKSIKYSNEANAMSTAALQTFVCLY